jgi:hypothetical protein
MNKKTKTMFVVLPGGFSAGGTIFSTYEFQDNSKGESYPTLAQEIPSAAATRQTDDNRNWTQAVVRLPEVIRRTVWLPLARRVQKLGQAA